MAFVCVIYTSVPNWLMVYCYMFCSTVILSQAFVPTMRLTTPLNVAPHLSLQSTGEIAVTVNNPSGSDPIPAKHQGNACRRSANLPLQTADSSESCFEEVQFSLKGQSQQAQLEVEVRPQDHFDNKWRCYELMATVFVVKENSVDRKIFGETSESLLFPEDHKLSQLIVGQTAWGSTHLPSSKIKSTEHLVAHIKVSKSEILHPLHQSGQTDQREAIASCSEKATHKEEATTAKHLDELYDQDDLSSCSDSVDPHSSNRSSLLPGVEDSLSTSNGLAQFHIIEDESTRQSIDSVDKANASRSIIEPSPSTTNETSESQWITVNDYIITIADEREVTDTTAPWKSMTTLFFVCKNFSDIPLNRDVQMLLSSESESLQNEILPFSETPTDCKQHANHDQLLVCPIPRSVILANNNLSRHPSAPSSADVVFTPFTSTEIDIIEQRGMKLALDAEFVMMSFNQGWREDSLSFARLSLLRAEGPLEGIPCLDAHIVTQPEPQDYLTQYSGLRAGDLSATHSAHWLTTRKTVYQKLRYLLDHQCIFIGHGLSKDFSIINMFVPHSQIIDTVQLYRLPGRRLLSLRFLAHHVLQLNIQQSVLGHDSVEDASAAFQLYKYYERLKASGDLPAMLRYLYKIGTQTNWTVTPLQTTKMFDDRDSEIVDQQKSLRKLRESDESKNMTQHEIDIFRLVKAARAKAAISAKMNLLTTDFSTIGGSQSINRGGMVSSRSAGNLYSDEGHSDTFRSPSTDYQSHHLRHSDASAYHPTLSSPMTSTGNDDDRHELSIHHPPGDQRWQRQSSSSIHTNSMLFERERTASQFLNFQPFPSNVYFFNQNTQTSPVDRPKAGQIRFHCDHNRLPPAPPNFPRSL